RDDLVRFERDELVALVLVKCDMLFAEPALGRHLDDARFASMEDDLAVLALQSQGNAAGYDEPDNRSEEEQHTQPVGHVVQRHVEVRGDEVGRRRTPHHAIPDHAGHANTGAEWGVPRAVEQVMLPIVLGDPAFDPRPTEHGTDQDRGGDHGQQDVEDEVVIAPREGDDPFEAEVPEHTRHEAQRTVDPADVPVRLGACGDGGGVVRTVVPDRVDGEEARDGGDDAEHDEEEAAGLGRVDGPDGEADDVVVGPAGAAVLGVLVHYHHEQVDGNHQQDHGRYEHDVQHVESTDDRGTREFPAEQEGGDVGADQ